MGQVSSSQIRVRPQSVFEEQSSPPRTRFFSFWDSFDISEITRATGLNSEYVRNLLYKEYIAPHKAAWEKKLAESRENWYLSRFTYPTEKFSVIFLPSEGKIFLQLQKEVWCREGSWKKFVLACDIETGRLRASAGMLETLDHEIAFLRKFSGHPGFVKLFAILQYPKKSAKEEEDEPVPLKTRLILEYLPETLEEALKNKKRPLTTPQREKIFNDIIRALAFIHEQGAMHRDLKPANVLLTQERNAKFGDLGSFCKKENWIARQERRTPPAYAFPELAAAELIEKMGERCEARARAVGEEGDAFQAGLTLAELLQMASCPWEHLNSTPEVWKKIRDLKEGQWPSSEEQPNSPKCYVCQLLHPDPVKRLSVRTLAAMLPQINWKLYK